jgi:hypothetical protein
LYDVTLRRLRLRVAQQQRAREHDPLQHERVVVERLLQQHRGGFGHPAAPRGGPQHLLQGRSQARPFVVVVADDAVGVLDVVIEWAADIADAAFQQRHQTDPVIVEDRTDRLGEG